MGKLLGAFFLLIMAVNCHADWWENMQLYQIYPRSFMDSNGDGIGDLKGITQRLPHLADIGINCTWLSPIFVSPMKDFGYDTADFYNIAEEYGTLQDLKDLLAEAKRLNIKVLLDFVPNHSSDQCEWFEKSVNREPGYENYYVWHPGRVNPEGGRNLPPSNWISVFRFAAWTWHPVRQEYYLHQFLPEQPDLNYRDPNLIAEMKNVLKYWLDVGVDGFRIDAIPHLIEVDVDETGNYPDEPLSGLTDDEDDYNYLDHIHTRERDETFDMVYQWRKLMDDYTVELNTTTKIIIMEAMSEIDIVMKYYGNETTEGAHFPFNFELAFMNGEADAYRIKERIDAWFSKVPEGRVTNWVAGNHDQPRITARFGDERADQILMLTMLLPGVAVTYYGEEIGMKNQYLSWEDTQDPQGCNSGPDLYNITSRDPQRTPFQWDATKNAGFSSGDKTWLPVADNYLNINLANQKAAEKSTYKMYIELAKLRQTDVLQNGELKIEALDEDCLVFTRSKNGANYVVAMNTGDHKHTEDLTELFPELNKNMRIIVTSVNSPKTPLTDVDITALELEAYEALVLYG